MEGFSQQLDIRAWIFHEIGSGFTGRLLVDNLVIFKIQDKHNASFITLKNNHPKPVNKGSNKGSRACS